MPTALTTRSRGEPSAVAAAARVMPYLSIIAAVWAVACTPVGRGGTSCAGAPIAHGNGLELTRRHALWMLRVDFRDQVWYEQPGIRLADDFQLV